MLQERIVWRRPRPQRRQAEERRDAGFRGHRVGELRILGDARAAARHPEIGEVGTRATHAHEKAASRVARNARRSPLRRQIASSPINVRTMRDRSLTTRWSAATACASALLGLVRDIDVHADSSSSATHPTALARCISIGAALCRHSGLRARRGRIAIELHTGGLECGLAIQW